ncbi:DsbA family protein [Candidatus Saccharibacteria bacterium]|nr:DsbA family protein [Candidatus Saccharibacteria bacterium]
MNTRLWIFLAVLVVATVGGLVWYKNQGGDTAAYTEHLDGTRLITKQSIIDAMKESGKQDIDESTIIPDHFLGKKDSKVIVIEYEDFACSACNSLAPYATKIHEEFQDRVLFIYRHFSINQNTSTLSQSGAEAAFLLGGTDAFWQMHELIFSDDRCVEGQEKSGCEEAILGYAELMKLDKDKFKTALTDYMTNGIKDKINRDKALGVVAGVTATPTWLINGEEIRGANYNKMREAIEQALKDTK